MYVSKIRYTYIFLSFLFSITDCEAKHNPAAISLGSVSCNGEVVN